MSCPPKKFLQLKKPEKRLLISINLDISPAAYGGPNMCEYNHTGFKIKHRSILYRVNSEFT